MRYHLFPFLIPRGGCCYELVYTMDAEAKYFKAEQAWENILAVLQQPWYKKWWYQPWLCWEMVADYEQISYRIWFPNEEIASQVRSKFQAEFPETEFVPVLGQGVPIDLGRPHSGVKLKLKRHWSLPFKTFTDDVVDTQAELVGTFEMLRPGEQVVVQFLVKPLSNQGRTFGRVLNQLDQENDGNAEEMRDKIYYDAINSKRARGLAHVGIKAMATADTKEEARKIIRIVRKSFGTFSQSQLNSFYAREWWQMVRPVFRYEFRNRVLSMEVRNRKTYLSTREMSLLMRTPSRKVEVNKLNRMKMRRTPLPQEVKRLNDKVDGIQLHVGEHFYHGNETSIVFDIAGLNRHTAIWGGTSMGKSTFLYNFLEDFSKARTDENQLGFTVIDPHGSLAKDVASRIPKDQQYLIRYVRFADGDFPFNVFDVDFQASADKVAQNITDVCKRVWKDFWGPNVDDNFFNASMALQKVGKASIPNLQRMLEDKVFGFEVMEALDRDDPLERQLQLYFSQLYELKDREYQVKTNSTLNKLRKITLSDTLNRLLSAYTNGIQWREGMDEGYYHIFDLSGLAPFEKQFLGSLCLSFSQLAGLSREDLYAAGKPMPLHLVVVDEAPMFMSHSADAIQSFADELRKYNEPLILGMQGMEGQVPDQVASAIFRNFGNMIAYRVGNEKDRENIYQNLKVDYLTADDFKEMDANYAYIRMAIGRETTRPFLVLMKSPSDSVYVEDLPILKERTVDRAKQREQDIVERLEVEQAAREARKVVLTEQVFAESEAASANVSETEPAETKGSNPEGYEKKEKEDVDVEDVFM